LIKYPIIIKILGFLLIIEALGMLTAIPFSIYYNGYDLNALIFSTVITFVFGLGLVFATRRFSEEPGIREGYAIVTFGWIFLSFFGALPFFMSNAIPHFANAFFETMSGFTTTGATILTDIEALPHGLLYWRSLTHWFGGMGIILLSIAILPILGVGGMQLFKAEVPGVVYDKITPRIKETAAILWSVYLGLTVIETLMLMLGGMSFFDAISHTFATMATGGFSTRNASVGAFDSPFIQYTIILFMFLAGINFVLHFQVLKGNFSGFFKSTEFRFYVLIIVTASVVIAFWLWLFQPLGVEKAIRDALFQVVSILTTTGFGTADYELWHPALQMLLFMMMFVGGMAGSTGGGMKVIRVLMVWRMTRNTLRSQIHPKGIYLTRIDGKTVKDDILNNVTNFVLIFVSIFFFGSLIMAATGLDIESAMGATIASLANIGPGLGSVGPTDNYAHITIFGKYFLSLLMLIGRLELFTVLVLFSRSYWRA
jgi:trk system potassium uptake protein TrkH